MESYYQDFPIKPYPIGIACFKKETLFLALQEQVTVCFNEHRLSFPALKPLYILLLQCPSLKLPEKFYCTSTTQLKPHHQNVYSLQGKVSPFLSYTWDVHTQRLLLIRIAISPTRL